MGEPLSFIVLMFGFVPVALVLSQDWSKALLISPVIAFALAGISAQAHVVLDLKLSQLHLLLIALQLLAVAVSLSRRVWRSKLVVALKRLRLKQAVISGLAISLSLLAYVSAGPPLAWDARSIWLSKASWLNGPASQYLIAQQDNLSGHPDYPLSGPSLMATFWDLQGVAENLQSGVALIAFLPIIVIALGSLYLLESMFGEDLKWTHVGFAFLLFGTSAFAANEMIGSGYMDVPLSSTLLALALLSLAYLLKPSVQLMIPLAALLIIANNLKQEGQIFSLVTIFVIALAFLLSTRNYSRVFRYLAPLASVFLLDRLLWSWFASFAGLPESSSTSSIIGNLPELFQPGSRFYELLAQLADRVGFINLLFWQIVTILVIIAARILFKTIGTNTMLFALALPVSSAGIYVVTALTYTLGGARDRLDWWLGTSYERITSTPELLLVGGWFVLGLLMSFHKSSLEALLSKDAESSELVTNRNG